MKFQINKIFKPIISIFQGLITVLGYGLNRRVTLEYPEQKNNLPQRFRGKPQPCRNESGKLTCIGCGLCVKVCPVNGVISLTKEKNAAGVLEVVSYKFDLSRCMFCGNCAYSCPNGHIIMSKEFELATENIETLLNKSSKQEVVND